MSDLKNVEADTISSTRDSDTPTKPHMVNEEDIDNSGKPAQKRRTSEWEALQIVAAGDFDTIDAEVAEIEADLQRMNLQSTWYKPLIQFRDPKFFTWLLVGACFREYLA